MRTTVHVTSSPPGHSSGSPATSTSSSATGCASCSCGCGPRTAPTSWSTSTTSPSSTPTPRHARRGAPAPRAGRWGARVVAASEACRRVADLAGYGGSVHRRPLRPGATHVTLRAASGPTPRPDPRSPGDLKRAARPQIRGVTQRPTQAERMVDAARGLLGEPGPQATPRSRGEARREQRRRLRRCGDLGRAASRRPPAWRQYTEDLALTGDACSTSSARGRACRPPGKSPGPVRPTSPRTCAGRRGRPGRPRPRRAAALRLQLFRRRHPRRPQLYSGGSAPSTGPTARESIAPAGHIAVAAGLLPPVRPADPGLDTRTLIGRATGRLMERYGLDLAPPSTCLRASAPDQHQAAGPGRPAGRHRRPRRPLTPGATPPPRDQDRRGWGRPSQWTHDRGAPQPGGADGEARRPVAGYVAAPAVGLGKRIGGKPAEAVMTEIQQRTAEQLFRTLGEPRAGDEGRPDALGPGVGLPRRWLALSRAPHLAAGRRSPMPTQTVREIPAGDLAGGLARAAGVWLDGGPTAAASIGQVHRGRWVDGREVAVKVQYPAADALLADLRQLALLARTAAPLVPGVDLCRWSPSSRPGRSTSSTTASRPRRSTCSPRRSGDDRRSWCPTWSTSARPCWSPSGSRARVPRLGHRGRHAGGARPLRRALRAVPLPARARTGMLHADPHPGNYRPPAEDGSPPAETLDFGAVARLPERACLRLRLLQASPRGRRRRWSSSCAAKGSSGNGLPSTAASCSTTSPRSSSRPRSTASTSAGSGCGTSSRASTTCATWRWSA